MIFVPAAFQPASCIEMVAIDPHDLQEAQDRDAGPPPAPVASLQSQPQMTRQKD
jgi:hypothetical protein